MYKLPLACGSTTPNSYISIAEAQNVVEEDSLEKKPLDGADGSNIIMIEDLSEEAMAYNDDSDSLTGDDSS